MTHPLIDILNELGDRRPSWDEYGLILAYAASTRADCTRSRVGAVLMNARHEILGVGYNGAPAGVPGCATAGACPRGKLSAEQCAPGSDYANCIADHAERNAIRHTPPELLKGATLYTTREPCPSCWTLINAAGIVRVKFPENHAAASPRGIVEHVERSRRDDQDNGAPVV